MERRERSRTRKECCNIACACSSNRHATGIPPPCSTHHFFKIQTHSPRGSSLPHFHAPSLQPFRSALYTIKKEPNEHNGGYSTFRTLSLRTRKDSLSWFSQRSASNCDYAFLPTAEEKASLFSSISRISSTKRSAISTREM